MTFPSYSSIFIFLPIVVIGWFFLNRKSLTLAKVFLAVASLVFYAFAGVKALVVLILSAAINYAIVRVGFDRVSKRAGKLILAVGIAVNLLALFYCKYLTYFENIINKLSGSNLTFEAIVLPLGISYFTFSQIAHLVDSYRDEAYRPSFIDYLLFVSFFPKISVGPIALSTEMIVQFNDEKVRHIDYDNMARGFYAFVLGLSKKLLLADNIGTFVDLGYANIASLGTTNALLTILGYTLQIYFDFSGYCDMASGICRMMNIDLPDNFDAPYQSLSVAEFWKRWHITLTRFFRNYLYIPLGGNRKGKIRTYINNFIIFVVSGLWHGAATQFVVWGVVHAFGSIFSKIASPIMGKLPKFVRWLLTFSFVNLAWVLFRSPDIGTAMQMFKQLFTGGIISIDINIVAAAIPAEGKLIQWIVLKSAPQFTYYSGCAVILAMLLTGLLIATRSKTVSAKVREFKPTRVKVFTTVMLFAWSVLSLSEMAEFIYVNF